MFTPQLFPQAVNDGGTLSDSECGLSEIGHAAVAQSKADEVGVGLDDTAETVYKFDCNKQAVPLKKFLSKKKLFGLMTLFKVAKEKVVQRDEELQVGWKTSIWFPFLCRVAQEKNIQVKEDVEVIEFESEGLKSHQEYPQPNPYIHQAIVAVHEQVLGQEVITHRERQIFNNDKEVILDFSVSSLALAKMGWDKSISDVDALEKQEELEKEMLQREKVTMHRPQGALLPIVHCVAGVHGRQIKVPLLALASVVQLNQDEPLVDIAHFRQFRISEPFMRAEFERDWKRKFEDLCKQMKQEKS